MTQNGANELKALFEVGLSRKLSKGEIDENEANRLREKLAKDIEELLNN